jgi:thioredoxin-like negative regulator of GroEL
MIEIADIAGFNEVKISGKSCLLFFYAKWQEESLNADLKDLMVAMSAKYPQINFRSVEAENIPELNEIFRVSVVPTFVAIKGSDTIGKVEGANPADLSKLVKQLSALQSQSTETGKSPSPGNGTSSNIETTLKNLINTG